MGRLMLFYELNKQLHDWLNLKQILNNSEFIPRQEQKLTQDVWAAPKCIWQLCLLSRDFLVFDRSC